MPKRMDGNAPEQVQEIVRTLAAARISKGLSQVELAKRLGAPQSHISRLEAGKVDIRSSNLVELARLVDLEIMLVPRTWVPAVRKLIQDRESESPFLYRLTQ